MPPSDPTMSAYVGLSQHIDFGRLPSPRDRFELCDLIGEGTYGEVFSARDRQTGTQVAVKILETIADNLEEIEEEFLVLRDLSQHPNLPEFVGMFLKRGACVEDDQLWFVMEVSVVVLCGLLPTIDRVCCDAACGILIGFLWLGLFAPIVWR